MLDFGFIYVSTCLQKRELGKNYKTEEDQKKLYDYYETQLNKVTIFRTDNIGTLLQPDSQRHNYIRNLALQGRFYTCIEPMHPIYPKQKIGVLINTIDIVFTDLSLLYLIKLAENAEKEIVSFMDILMKHKTNYEKIIASTQIVLSEIFDDSKSETGTEIGTEIGSEDMSVVGRDDLEVDLFPTKPTGPVIQKNKENLTYSPNKLNLDALLHIESFSIEIGKGYPIGDVIYASYTAELLKIKPNEVPFQRLIWFGFNGLTVHATQQFTEAISIQCNLYLLYLKDMQPMVFLNKTTGTYSIAQLISSDFQYIISSPAIPHMPNQIYATFPEVPKFFDAFEQSTKVYFLEKIYLMEIKANYDKALKKADANISFNSIRIVVPVHSLTPPFYMISTIVSAWPKLTFLKSLQKPQANIVPVQQNKVEPISIRLKMKMGKFEFKLPLNVLSFY